MGPVRLSLLERIARASGRQLPPPATTEDLRREVRWNIEWILNHRRGRRPLPDLLDHSILGYGLPDFDLRSFHEDAARDRIANLVAESIRRFEPRLTDIKVTIAPEIGKDLRIRARLSAMLKVEPENEPFAVDALLDLSTHEVVVT